MCSIIFVLEDTPEKETEIWYNRYSLVIDILRVFYAKKIFNWRRELNYPIKFSEFLQIFAFLQRVIARIWYVQNIHATLPAILCKNVHDHFHLDVDLRTIETRNNTAAAMQIHCVPSLRIRIKILLYSCQFRAKREFFSSNPTTKT